MALIWADGFDHYGGSGTFIGQGGYVSVDTQVFSNSANARTGNGYIQTAGGAAQELLRAISPVSVVGQGAGFRQNVVSSFLNVSRGMTFHTALGTIPLWVVPNLSNGFDVLDVNRNSLGSSAPNLFVLGTWYWLEAQVIANSGVGTSDASVIVKFQGQLILTVTGLNINGPFTHIGLGSPYNQASANLVWWDDWVIWDNTGTSHNTFLGDRRCITSYPNANGANQDWTPAVAPAWSELNKSPPVDGTSYIDAAAVGNVSEFAHTPLGILSNDIAGVMMVVRALKTDAGACSFTMGVHSGSFILNSPSLFPGTSGGYLQNIFETDPNGSIQWTQPAYDAMTMRVTRDS